MISLFLFGFLCSTSTALAKSCSPSSCGNLSITYPFRLQEDQRECGKFDLECQGNNTIFTLNSGKYYVKEINYTFWQLTLVDINVASGPCRLPTLASLSDYLSSDYFSFYGYWIYFVNCTEEVYMNIHFTPENYIPKDYIPVPCLTGNGIYVYYSYFWGTDDMLPVLPKACRLIRVAPAPSKEKFNFEVTPQHRIVSSGMDILEEMSEYGFVVEWIRRPIHIHMALLMCWKESDLINLIAVPAIFPFRSIWRFPPLLSAQVAFLGCFYASTYEHSHLTFNLAVIMIVLLDIILFQIVIGVFARIILHPLVTMGFLAHTAWKKFAPVDNVEKFLQSQNSLMPTRYSYADIIGITNNFKEKLGQGGFGSVFVGTLPGDYKLAVKVLRNSKTNGDEFINEVSTIGRIHHMNIVQLIGYCADGPDRALVYEFMPNGSLDKYIFSKGTDQQFAAEKLNQIALGVARGIDYLHRGCDMRILHFDIKPHNILLDHNMTPKVADFGLAKLYPKDYSLATISAARGTIGYIAPELISRNFGVVSDKSDVYSFGMLLLEMAGKRRNVDSHAEQSSRVYYPSWIYDRLSTQNMTEISETFEIDELEKKLAVVGLWCIQTRSIDRPPMSKVIEMLEANVDILTLPPKPFHSSPEAASTIESILEGPSQLSIITEDEPVTFSKV